MSRISETAPLGTVEFDADNSPDESQIPSLDSNELDALPQGVISLLQQWMPAQTLLAMHLSRLHAPPSSQSGQGAESALEDAGRVMRTVPAKNPERASQDRSSSPTSVNLLNATSALEGRASQVLEVATESRALKPSRDDDLQPLGPPVRSGHDFEHCFEHFAARSRGAAGARPTPERTSSQAALNAAPAPQTDATDAGASYLRLPFNHDGVSGVVTVNRQGSEWAAPLQLSASHAQISAYLSRQLDLTPQQDWAMAQDQPAGAGDEQRERRHSQDSHQEQPDDFPGAPAPEEH